MPSYDVEEQRRGMAVPEWKAWYERFIPLVESGRREIFTLLE